MLRASNRATPQCWDGLGTASTATLGQIEPGQVRTFNMEIGILDGADEIRAFERRVKAGLVRKDRRSSTRR